MRISVKQWKKVRDSVAIILISMAVSVVYPLFADDLSNTLAFVNSLSIGVIGGTFISLLELDIFSINREKHSFLVIYFLKTFSYFVFFALLIPFVKGFNESVYYQEDFLVYINSEQFRRFIFHEDYVIILFYALACIALIIFTRMMGRKLGKTTLINFISGKYHEPKEAERIFMYLDLRSSTTIAEKLGAINYHSFLRVFFSDVSECILATKGNIYRYVADQVVVTWRMRNGIKNANCIKTYFELKEKFEKEKSKYLDKYRFEPKFSTCFHCGKVIIGEIGDVKSQIVFQGEVLHQTSEIEKKCSELNQEILISDVLAQKLVLPAKYEKCKIAELAATKGQKMSLYTLRAI